MEIQRNRKRKSGEKIKDDMTHLNVLTYLWSAGARKAHEIV